MSNKASFISCKKYFILSGTVKALCSGKCKLGTGFKQLTRLPHPLSMSGEGEFG
ncbi:hypothetical protein MTBBW1_2130017 [Desulfamplus magnetovallimortis]|uniref:Uncharacterized protein n=1 Tax=Desulfamplus magnetovallimortis TaxID=1246637 RepID=A0A1W1HCJ7_9BACT|nr:hypothetical protein MTBBW1_2130017 [Desulfamplus magnetovallimortis]